MRGSSPSLSLLLSRRLLLDSHPHFFVSRTEASSGFVVENTALRSSKSSSRLLGSPRRATGTVPDGCDRDCGRRDAVVSMLLLLLRWGVIANTEADDREGGEGAARSMRKFTSRVLITGATGRPTANVDTASGRAT